MSPTARGPSGPRKFAYNVEAAREREMHLWVWFILSPFCIRLLTSVSWINQVSSLLGIHDIREIRTAIVWFKTKRLTRQRLNGIRTAGKLSIECAESPDFPLWSNYSTCCRRSYSTTQPSRCSKRPPKIMAWRPTTSSRKYPNVQYGDEEFYPR